MTKMTINEKSIVCGKAMYAVNQEMGLASWNNFVCNANLDVGRVTILFSIFNHTMAMAKRAIKIGSDKNAEYVSAMNDCKKIFRQVFKCTEKVTEYESPLGEIYVDDDGILSKDVCNETAAKAVTAIHEMALTPENILSASQDMLAIGRMYQEQTIDAAKTGMNIVICNCEELKRIKLRSRNVGEKPFGVRMDWKTNEVIASKDDDTTRFVKLYPNAKNTTLLVNDLTNQVRNKALNYVEELANEFKEMKQAFSPVTVNWINKLGKEPANQKYIDICTLVKETYMTVNGAQTKALEEINKVFGDPKEREAQKKSVKARFTKTFNALSNTLRKEMKDLSDIHKVAMLLYVVFQDKHSNTGNKGLDSEVSNIANVLLEPEFFKFVMTIFKNDNSVPKYTEDSLLVCTFEDGDKAEFILGEAVLVDDNNKVIKHAIAKDTDLPDGVYEFHRKDNGQMVIRRSIMEMVKVPEVDENQLFFVTRDNAENSALIKENSIKMTKENAEVTLIAYAALNGKRVCGDSVVVNNEIIGNFRTTVNGKGICPNLANMYNFKVGKVEALETGISNKGNTIAVIVLKDVHSVKIDASKLTKVQPTKSVVKEVSKRNSLMDKFNAQTKPQVVKHTDKTKGELTSSPKIINAVKSAAIPVQQEKVTIVDKQTVDYIRNDVIPKILWFDVNVSNFIGKKNKDNRANRIEEYVNTILPLLEKGYDKQTIRKVLGAYYKIVEETENSTPKLLSSLINTILSVGLDHDWISAWKQYNIQLNNSKQTTSVKKEATIKTRTTKISLRCDKFLSGQAASAF